MRQKRVLSDLELENQHLLEANQTLADKLKSLEEENARLKSIVQNPRQENKFSISTDIDSEKEHSLCLTISRSDPVLSMKNETPFKALFFFAAICLLALISGLGSVNSAV